MNITTLLRLGIFSLVIATSSHAAIILQQGAGLTGSGVAQAPGVGFTTPSSVLGWSNISFNWYNSANGNPLADGNVYLLSSEYLGTPAALSAATPGYLGVGTATGSIYTFDPSVTLSPNTQYYVYANNRPNGPGGNTVVDNIFPATTYYGSPNGSGNFQLKSFFDAAFSLEGTESVPEPSRALLALLGLASIGARRRRK